MIVRRGKEIDLPALLMPCTCERGDLRWDGDNAWRCERVGKRSEGIPSCGRAVPIGSLFEEYDLDWKLELGFHPRNLELSIFAIEHLFAGLIWVEWLSRNEIERYHLGVPDRKRADEQQAVYGWVMRQMPRTEIPEYMMRQTGEAAPE